MVGSHAGVWIVYTLVLLALGKILHVQLGDGDDAVPFDEEEEVSEEEPGDPPVE